MADAPLVFVIGEDRYQIDVEDFSGVDWRDFRIMTGLRPRQALRAVVDLDMEAIAGFLWLVRRRGDPTLGFLPVLESLNLATFEIDGGGVAQEETANPPA